MFNNQSNPHAKCLRYFSELAKIAFVSSKRWMSFVDEKNSYINWNVINKSISDRSISTGLLLKKLFSPHPLNNYPG